MNALIDIPMLKEINDRLKRIEESLAERDRDDDGELWDTRKTADYLNRSEYTIREWVKEGKLPCIRKGRGHMQFQSSVVKSVGK